MGLHHVHGEGRAVEGVALVREEVAGDGGAVHGLLAGGERHGVRHDHRHDRAEELVWAVLQQPLLRHQAVLRHPHLVRHGAERGGEVRPAHLQQHVLGPAEEVGAVGPVVSRDRLDEGLAVAEVDADLGDLLHHLARLEAVLLQDGYLEALPVGTRQRLKEVVEHGGESVGHGGVSDDLGDGG